MKKEILKVFSLTIALCMVTGCNSITVETQTQETEAPVITTVTTENTEETEGIKYCEIPEGMTFEDLKGLIYYNGVQLHLPCTIDEIVSLCDEVELDLYGDEYEYEDTDGIKKTYVVTDVASLKKFDKDGNFIDSISIGTRYGDLNNYNDICKFYSFNVGDGENNTLNYCFYKDLLSFNGIQYGDDFSKVKDLLGEPSLEQLHSNGNVWFCMYYFKENDKIICFEFDGTEEGKFTSARFFYEEKN